MHVSLSAADLTRARRPLLRRALSRAASAIVAAVAALAADPAGATTADDLCSPTADPCQISRNITIDPGSDIDVGLRELLIAGRGALDLTGGTLTVRAGTLTVQTGGSVLARGAAAEPGGRILVLADTITMAGMIDASGGPGGTVTLTATGMVLVAGIIDVRSRNSDSGGGTIEVQGGDVSIANGGRIVASGGADAAGGDVSLRATAGMVIGADINASGGDGGTIDLTAGNALTVNQNVTLDADATGTAGSGGEIDLTAGGAMALNGEVTAVGRNGSTDTGGGDGGTITIDGGSIDVPIAGARLTVQAGNPDGIGGDIDLTSTAGAVNIQGQLIARGTGSDGSGGTVSVDAAASAMLAGMIDDSGGGGGGGSIEINGAMDVTIAATAAVSVDANGAGRGGEIDVSGDGMVLVSGVLSADGGSGTGSHGGTIDVSGCTAQLDQGSRLSSLRSSGTNTLSGRDLSVVAGMMRADPSSGRNRIRYAGSQNQPSILPGAQIDPPIALIVDGTIVPCNPVATMTPTVTPTVSTPTRTQTTPTSTPTGAVIRCTGDCDGSGVVIISELIVGVNIALDSQPVANCRAFDVNSDGRVLINELIQGVANALSRCPR